MTGEVVVEGVTVPAAIANRFDSTSRGKSPFSYTKPTPGEAPRNTRIPVPRVLNWLSDEESEGELPYSDTTKSNAMPQAVHLQYNSPMGMYSKEAVEEQYVQQIGDGAIALPAPAPDRHFDPSKSATLRYLQENERDDGFGKSLQDKLNDVERPRQFETPEPQWADFARARSERARSRTPGNRAQSEPNDWSHPPSRMGREYSKTPMRDDDPREFQEKTKTYVHDKKDLCAPYYAHPEFQQPNRQRSYHHDHIQKGYECGGTDYTKGMTFEGPSPYDYVETRRVKKEDKRYPPGYQIGGTDFGTGYVAPGPYHGHGPDPPRLRPRYTADPRAPVNPYIAPNVDSVDPHLLVGDTLSNMKVAHDKNQKGDMYFGGLAYRPAEGFKPEHRTSHRRQESLEPTLYCTNFRNTAHRSSSVPRSSAPPEQTDVWRYNQEQTEKEVNVRSLLDDSALMPRRWEHIPNWREKSLEKHISWQNLNDPRNNRPEVFSREPNWTRSVQQRKGAWEQKAWDTDARVALPASQKVGYAPPPFWHNHAQQKQQTWQNVANQMGTNQQQINQGYSNNQQNGYTQYQQQPQQDYSYQTTTTVTGSGAPQQNGEKIHEIKLIGAPVPAESNTQYSTQNYQTNSYSKTATGEQPVNYTTSYSSYNTNGTNAENVLNTGFNQNQVDYLQARRDKYIAGGHGGAGSGSGYTQFGGTQGGNTNTNYSANYSSQQQQQSSHETRTSKTTTSQTQNAPITKTTTYSYSQQPIAAPPAAPLVQTSQSSTTHTVNQSTVPAQSQQSQQYFQQQQQERRERSTTREEVRPAQTQQYYQEQQQHRREETKTTEQQVRPVQTQYFQQQQQQRREEKHTREETTRPVVQQQFYQQQQQQRREESTTREETVKPVVQQQFYQQQQQQRREESTTREETVKPVVQQQYYQQQQQQRREESSTREETVRPVSQASHFSEQRQHHKTETRTENTRTLPLQSSSMQQSANNSSTTQVTTSEAPVNRKLEMSETLPMGVLSNTQANTQGSYKDVEGHNISYKRDLQTTADPGREVALLKEEERKVVENELEPGVISRHITTKYYKKKTVTDTTTSTQDLTAGDQYSHSNATQNHTTDYRATSMPYDDFRRDETFEKYEQTQDYVPQNLSQFPRSVQNEFNEWTHNEYANQQNYNSEPPTAYNTLTKKSDLQNLYDNVVVNACPDYRAMPAQDEYHQQHQHQTQEQAVYDNTPNHNTTHSYQPYDNVTNQNMYQNVSQNTHQSLAQNTHQNVHPNTQQQYFPPPQEEQQFSQYQQHDTTTEYETESKQQKTTPPRRSQSEPRSMEERELWKSGQYSGSKRVNIGTLLDDTALIPERTVEIPHWFEHSLRRHHSWKNIRDPYVPVTPGADMEGGPTWTKHRSLRQGAWEKRMHDWEMKLNLPPGSRFDRCPPPFWTNRSIRAHNVWQNVAEHVAFQNHNTNYIQPHHKVSINTTSVPQFGLHYEQKEQTQEQQTSTQTSAAQQDARLTPNINDLQAANVPPQYSRYELKINDEERKTVVSPALSQYHTPLDREVELFTRKSEEESMTRSTSKSIQETMQQAIKSTTAEYQGTRSTDNVINKPTDINIQIPPPGHVSSHQVQQESQTTQQQFGSFNAQIPPPGQVSSHQIQQESQTSRQQFGSFNNQAPITSNTSTQNVQHQMNSQHQHIGTLQMPTSNQVSTQQLQQVSDAKTQQQQHQHFGSTANNLVNSAAFSQQQANNSSTSQSSAVYNKQTISQSNEVQTTTSSNQVVNPVEMMSETLPAGLVASSVLNSQGSYKDEQGNDVQYSREYTVGANPEKEYKLLKESTTFTTEERLEPGVIARHVTTKYYKRKSVSDHTTESVIVN